MQKSLLVVIALILLLSGEAIAKKHHGKHKGSKSHSHSKSHSKSKSHSRSSGEEHGPKALVTKAQYYVYLTELNYGKIHEAIQQVISTVSNHDGQELSTNQLYCIETVNEEFYKEVMYNVRDEYVELFEEARAIKEILQGKRCDKNCEKRLKQYVAWNVPDRIGVSLNNIKANLVIATKPYQTKLISCYEMH